MCGMLFTPGGVGAARGFDESIVALFVNGNWVVELWQCEIMNCNSFSLFVSRFSV